MAQLKRGVLARLEHGVVNPSRHEFLKVLDLLELPAQEKEVAGRLLEAIFPKESRKHHLRLSILQHRNRHR
jgi:hypothetical protein